MSKITIHAQQLSYLLSTSDNSEVFEEILLVNGLVVVEYCHAE